MDIISQRKEQVLEILLISVVQQVKQGIVAQETGDSNVNFSGALIMLKYSKIDDTIKGGQCYCGNSLYRHSY